MDVILDGTPLLGPRTGVGQYVAHLYAALRDEPGVRPRLYAFTVRRGGRPADVQPGDWLHRILPARALQRLWTAGRGPGAGLLLPRTDVLHATNFVGPPARRVGRVVTVHDLTFLRYPELVHARTAAIAGLIRRQAREADAVLTPSAAVAAEVVEDLGVPADRVRPTPLGVDGAWFDAVPPSAEWRRRHGLPDRYLLAVGTREPRKNLGMLLTAHRAAGAGGVLPLVLVGPPGWGEDVVDDRDVLLLPYQPAENLRALVAGAAALVFPTRYEGFGLPALEAMAAGTPVLASDLPVLREVLGDCGDHVDTTDPEALAEGLRRVSAAPDDEAGRRVRQARAAAFTWQRCAAATAEAYRSATSA
ncbi:glycosyltransferase family 4 protein [Geodermatophilus sp. SYSU D00691]